MQLFKKILKISGLIFVILLAAGCLYTRNIARRAIPDYNRSFTLENLQDEVRVFRDANAVPSIYASNEQDLYRAVGFVMAQDRLWQMDLIRRAAVGKLSEIFGEDFVDADLLIRSLRIPEKSALILQWTDPDIISALEAFADGVNQFIDRHRRKLPPEFSILGYKPEKWKAEHSVHLAGYLAWEIGGEWSTELILHRLRQKLDEDKFRELIPNLDLQESYVHPQFELADTDLHTRLQEPSAKLRDLGLDLFRGSNNWVVSGSRSTTGKPLFANDMHMFFLSPGIWYQMHHVIEGELNVTGIALPGQPLIMAGHNERIAWGMTSAFVNNVDFYLETINPDNPHQYKFMGEWRDMEARSESIKTGKNSSVEKKILFTHRGPVVSDFKNLDDQVISMKWMGDEYSNKLRSIYLLNRAGNWEEFRDAVSTIVAISQNINYADVEGNIGLQTAAGIPVREGAGIFVVSGEDDTYDWQGMVPFEELPYTYNPPEGFIIAANNRTVPDDYPYYVSHWFHPPKRYDRIKEMIMKKERLSVDDFRAIQGDKKSELTEQMLPGLLAELEKIPRPSVNEKKAIEKLKGWDMVYRPDSPGPLIFEKFYVRFLENTLLEEMGDELYSEFLTDRELVRNFVRLLWIKCESAWFEGDKSQTGTGTFSDVVRKSFHETIEWIENNSGTDPERWAWGDFHKLTLEHPMGSVRLLDLIFRMNRGPWSPGGSFHTVSSYSYDYNDPFRIFRGPSHRHIYSTGNWDESLSIVPTGTSGIPASDYYCDQTQWFADDRYRSDLFSANKVEEAARYSMKLIPVNW